MLVLLLSYHPRLSIPRYDPNFWEIKRYFFNKGFEFTNRYNRDTINKLNIHGIQSQYNRNSMSYAVMFSSSFCFKQYICPLNLLFSIRWYWRKAISFPVFAINYYCQLIIINANYINFYPAWFRKTNISFG